MSGAAKTRPTRSGGQTTKKTTGKKAPRSEYMTVDRKMGNARMQVMTQIDRDAMDLQPMERVILSVDGRRYEVPREVVAPLLVTLQPYESGPEKLIPADDVFKKLGEEFNHPGAVLHGMRLKEDMNQTELAKKLGVAQNVLSDMETGRRVISAKTAKKLAEIFETDYRVFL